MRKAALLCAALSFILVEAADAHDCAAVVFDRTDKSLGVRTLVIEGENRQRSLVLTNSSDTSLPCQLEWWLQHNPQGVVQCIESDVDAADSDGRSRDSQGPGMGCPESRCQADTSYVELGYVRTMVASVVFTPEPHSLSALCIELGCRSRIVRTKVPGTLLEVAPSVRWVPRTDAKRVLVIGLGSSTMALWLRQWLPSGSELHIAELLPAVADAAPCFGLVPQAGSRSNSTRAAGSPFDGVDVHVHVADGRSFLSSRQDAEFDAIVLDAFDDNASLPACFRTRGFFELARKKLKPRGVLSVNLLEGQSNVPLAILQSLVSGFFAGGPSQVWIGDAPGAQGIQNIVSVFAPGQRSSSRLTLAANGRGRDATLPAKGTAASEGHINQAHEWFASAHYRLLPLPLASNVEALEDATQCPSALS